LSYKKKDMAPIAKKLGGALLIGLKGVKKASEKILAEIKAPTGSLLHRKNQGWVPFVTICTARQVQDCAGLFPMSSGALLLPLQAGGCFYYQPDLRYRENEFEKTRKAYVTISTKLLKAGILFPRPSALMAKQVAAKNPGNFKLLRSIKKAVDPKNIMNPGKLGL
jgi:FAD/FMN-containing dehydrogenase